MVSVCTVLLVEEGRVSTSVDTRLYIEYLYLYIYIYIYILHEMKPLSVKTEGGKV